MIKESNIFTGIVNCPVCGKNHPVDIDSSIATPQGLQLEWEGDGEIKEILEECPNVDLLIKDFGWAEFDCYFSHIKQNGS